MKMYFYDTGLVCSLLGIKRSQDIAQHYLRGALFENLIFAELMKNSYNQFRRPDIFFWRDNSGNEIDCILNAGPTERVVEIKLGTTVSSDFFKGLEYYRKLSGLSTDNFYLIYGSTAKQKRSSATLLGWDQLEELLND